MNGTSAVAKEIGGNIGKFSRGIFTKTDLKEIVITNLETIGSNEKELIRSQLLEYLFETKKLKEVEFRFPSRKEIRYLLGKITPLELAQSLKPAAYLEYEAATYIHGLTETFPETIYINAEQSKTHSRNPNSLTQEGINNAFRNKVRISNEIAEAIGIRVCVTHGQKTNALGVDIVNNKDGEQLRVTNIERTLIDITVRPVYVGGPQNVLKIYKKAAEKISTKTLKVILKKMDFVYPYAQAIGFYLDASGYFSDSDLSIFCKEKMAYDFYLDYQMKNPVYSKKWRVYYPSDLLR